MPYMEILKRVAAPLGKSIDVSTDLKVTIKDVDSLQLHIEPIVRTAALGKEPDCNLARYLIRECALELGIIPSSIDELYRARAAGTTRDDFSVPAINLRTLTFDAGRAAFRSAMKLDAKALIFEIARSEMSYTDQPPAEYVSSVLGAAIAEGYRGPVFIQGDHFQVNAKRYASDSQAEMDALRKKTIEAVKAGFYNIDIDTSTLVDLSKPTLSEQQKLNYTLCAELSTLIRQIQPEGITVSLGGEIGEIGTENSTEPELRAFMDGYNASLSELSQGSPGLSKISIQTGTSHGGVVLPDGSIAKVKVDFDTIKQLGRVAREYNMGGAVQHGASTLPEDAFGDFPNVGCLEVHLATGFQNIIFDLLPDKVCEEIYTYLRENNSHERKPGQTDDQFYYKTRKRALGYFKKAFWELPSEIIESISIALESEFTDLFTSLNIAGTKDEVERFVHPLIIHGDISFYLKSTGIVEDTSGLAD